MLQVFKAVPVAHDVHRDDAIRDRAREYARDTVTLGWDQRLKARGRRRSDSGFEFATALPRGTVLRDGDSFVFDDPAVVVRVVELAEPVFVVQPPDARRWALYAYHIGNSHQPLMITDLAIICPDVPGMQQVLEYHGIPFARDTRAFTPVAHVADHHHQIR